MEVEKIFHMNGGSGTTSYTKNSIIQMKASDMVKHILVETIEKLFSEELPETINIADMGCASGRNSLIVMKTIVETIEKIAVQSSSSTKPEFYVYLNDLPSNDFNSMFKALPDFFKQIGIGSGGMCSPVFVTGCPGSFYHRLLPKNTLHFVYSSYCLHWLSQVPAGVFNEKGESLNKGNLYISETSPKCVVDAYYSQFQEDFCSFLKWRSTEMVQRGRMMLIFLGRVDHEKHVDRGNSFYWELLSRSLAVLASQGNLNKEKVECYHGHYYAPSKIEVEEQVKKEGSFCIENLEMYQTEKKSIDNCSYGSLVSMTVRAAQEVMLRHHFGIEDDEDGSRVLDFLFKVYADMIDEEMAKEDIEPLTFLLVLRKL